MRWAGLALIGFICGCAAPTVPQAGAASPRHLPVPRPTD